MSQPSLTNEAPSPLAQPAPSQAPSPLAPPPLSQASPIPSLLTSKLEYDEKAGVYAFHCPHCQGIIQVEPNQFNCCIFRHGSFFIRNQRGEIVLTDQMNPHTPQAECERLYQQGLIVGCGKPFRLNRQTLTVEECGYI